MLVITACLATYPPAFAGDSPARSPEMTEAQLAQKLRFYQGIRVLDVHFEQRKQLKDMDLTLKSEGELHIERPSRFIWKITRPSPVSVSVSGQELTIVTGSGSTARTQVLKLGDAPSDQAARSLASMVAWLNMDAHVLSHEYRVFAVQAESYRFEPRLKSSAGLESLEMDLTHDGQLKQLRIRELSGDRLEIHFDKPRIAKTVR